MACTREPVQDPRAIRIRLKATDAPEAGIGERAVIEIHGVLCRHDYPNSKRAGLLHEGHDWSLGGWIGRVGREKAVDFVEHDECLELFGSGQRPDPGKDLLE